MLLSFVRCACRPWRCRVLRPWTHCWIPVSSRVPISQKKNAAHWLKCDRDEAVWSSSGPMTLACEILRMLGSRGKAAGVAPLCTESSDDASNPCVTDLSALEGLLKMFEVVGKIGCLFAWLKTHCVGKGAAPCVHNAHIHPSVEAALTAVANYLQDAEGLVSRGVSAAAADLRCCAWIFPIDSLEHWVTCAQAVKQAMCRKIMGVAVGQIASSALALMQVVPAYEHLLVGPKLNLPSIAKHLVHWPSKKALGTGCIALESAIKSASMVNEMWEFRSVLTDDEEFGEKMLQSTLNYDVAKKALIATAAVNCLTNMSGIEKLTKRDSLVTKQASLLPESLLKALQQLK